MRFLFSCRRTFLGFFAISGLLALGFYIKADVAGSIAMICLGIAGANAAEGAIKKNPVEKPEPKG